MTRIFISHSHIDEAIAYKLVNFLLAALKLEEEEIFCSSDPDLGLSYSSSSLTDQLKEKLKSSEALIILITGDSLHSAWIPFETGTFWTTDKPVIPILGPGLKQNDLPGPLRSFLSISIEAIDWKYKVNNAINQLVAQLEIEQKVSKRRDDTLQEFSDALRAWKSQRPATPESQQENERLEARIQELEKQLSEARSRLSEQAQSVIAQLQGKEKLERSLESKIEQLEQQLKQERSHNKQLQEMKATSQQEKEELEQNYQNQKQKLEQQQQKLEQQQQNIQHYQSQIKKMNTEMSILAIDMFHQKNQEISNEMNRVMEEIKEAAEPAYLKSIKKLIFGEKKK